MQPDTIVRLARVLEANPIDFYLAAGWIDPSDLTAYALPYAGDWQPIAAKLTALPEGLRKQAIALVGAVVDTVLERANKMAEA